MTPQLRRLLFETLYRNKYLYRFASTVPFAGQWRSWQRLVLPRLRGHDVLELGCGPGDLLADMQEAGFACCAVEQSPQMVAAARETLHKRRSGTAKDIIQGQAQKLPFPADSFDTIVSTFPSDYIFDPDTISEVARVLRPGGRLIVIEGANLLAVGFFQPILMLLQMLVYGQAAQRTSARQNAQDSARSPKRTIPLDKETGSGLTTEVVDKTNFGLHIPLEQFGLDRRSELVRSRRWIVSLTIGEKARH